MKRAFAILSLCVLLFSCSSNGGGDDTIIDPCGRPTSISTVNITIESVTVNWSSSETGASYEIQYGETGFVLGNGQIATGSNGSLEISGLAEGTDYQFYIRTNCGGNNLSDWIGPQNFSTALTDCPEAVNLTVTDIEESSVSVSWGNSSTTGVAPFWTLEYGPTGFSPNNGTEIVTGIPSTNITNLTPSTTYDYYVTAKCSDTNFGDRIGPFTFTTRDAANPNCDDPINFVVTDQSVQNVGGFDVPYAFFEWSPNLSQGNDFTIFYALEGDPLDPTNFFTTIFLNDMGLNNNGNHNVGIGSVFETNTTYDVYLKKRCTDTESSRWIGPVKVFIPE